MPDLLPWVGGGSTSDVPSAIVSSINGVQAGGTELTYTVPAGVLQRLLSMYVDLSCAAAVANRFPGYVCADENGNQFYLARTPTAWIASQRFVWSAGKLASTTITSTNASAVLLPFPNVWLWPGCIIKTACLALQAGDAYQAVNLFFEQRPLGSTTFP